MRISCFAIILMFFSACTTEDIAPTLVELNASTTSLSENDGTIVIEAILNANAAEQITIPFTIEGTATLNEDYSISSNQFVISAGANKGEITLTGLDDLMIESIETIVLKIGNTGNVILLQNFEITIEVLDNDTDTDNDGVPDSEDECPTVPGEIENNGCPYLGFLINEVLYDPAADAAGDANGDGTRDPNEDEFIEFFNSGPALDISGYQIYDASALSSNTPRHVFPAGTIVPSNGVIVVFGGGTPTGNFGNAIVQVASGGQINMNNAGDVVTIKNNNGDEIIVFDIAPLSANPDESYTRNPDISGDFVQHSTVSEANGALFSPGKRVNGSSF